jgi:NAD(P)-dependent dehydrogenase (short-subunit alcohol dehydrogenase family)
VNTEFTATWDPVVRQAVIDATPLGALASTGDVARAVLAAVTGLTHTTGVTIPVDGGMPLGTA